MAKHSFDAAAKRGDKEQAIHDYEELEEIVENLARASGGLQPPKEVFDDLVAECHEINSYAAKALAEAGKPFDHREAAKSIDAQRTQGHKAWAASDQKAYGDCITMLESIRNHLIALVQKVVKPPEISEGQQAEAHAQVGQKEAEKTGQIAAAQGREDLSQEAAQIKKQLAQLAREAQKNPKAVQEKVSALRSRLAQIWNMLVGKSDGGGGGKRVIDTSA
jgi:molecular chaperone DnaK